VDEDFIILPNHEAAAFVLLLSEGVSSPYQDAELNTADSMRELVDEVSEPSILKTFYKTLVFALVIMAFFVLAVLVYPLLWLKDILKGEKQ